MRLFFALWADPDVRRQFAHLARQLNLESRGRSVDPRNYHVTLAFVGEVSSPKLAVLQQIGRSVRAPQFAFECDSIEFWREPQVVVAAARAAPPGLLDLWTNLNEAIGLPRERLHAHVTLARKVVQAPVQQAMSPFYWSARSFSLVRSDTSGAHSVYTVVDTWPLLDETPKP